MARKKPLNPEGCFSCQHSAEGRYLLHEEIQWITMTCPVYKFLAELEETDLVHACDKNLEIGSGYASHSKKRDSGDQAPGATFHSRGRLVE